MARSSREGAKGDEAAPERESLKVLVVEDHPAVRSVIGRVLHEHAYEPVNASSVAEAMRHLTTTVVAAVILDVKLSGGESGLDLLEALRQQPGLASIPVVVMTGVPLSEEKQRAISDYGAYLLYKPEGLTALVGFLHKITGTDQPNTESQKRPGSQR